MPFASKFLIFVLTTLIAMSGCADPLWEPPSPGTVIVERFSPDNCLLARIIATGIKGTYNIEVSDVRTDDVLSEQRIEAPFGYHAHLVSLVWSKDNRTVTAIIDHDFGEDKRLVELRIAQSL